MSYVQVKCECGGNATIYLREDIVFKTGESLGNNTCDLCGARVETSIVVNTIKRYSIDCGYKNVEVDDHFPLEREELIKLLKIAATEKDVRNFGDIQGRVIQGIPGLKCPQRMDMHMIKKVHLVSKLFIDVDIDNINETADSIMEFYVSEVV